MSVSSSNKNVLDISGTDLKVMVLAGGVGQEREISVESGENVYGALRQAGFDTRLSDISPGNLGVLDEVGMDVFFIALHGRFGEDGELQQIMEERSLVYTGSGPAASRLAFDKLESKRLFSSAGISVPGYAEYRDGEEEDFQKRIRDLSKKVVIKPVRSGSSVGVGIFEDITEASAAARRCSFAHGGCFAEEHIAGREVTVGILNGEAMPVIEVRSKFDFYDYHSKYIDEGTEYLFDTIEDESLVARIQQAGLDCFEVLGCRDFGRVDLILGDDGRIYALEVNTIPGFTKHSLLPKAALKYDLPMPEVCRGIVKSALSRRAGKRL